ncbi:LIM homeobox transcription factor 1-beta-like, partial [Catharus ustulatus]|uniref:LIM homeobox transcription factor 1-beta-like n=1 Tax=Catharus ustulatus TaxID=91951 RepID=UPI00140A46D8
MKPEAAPSCREQRARLAPSLCSGCGSRIQDRFFCRVADGSSWHERCLRCCACGCALQGSCFCRGSKIYCRPDYERLFLQRCSRCQVPVGRSEPILRVLQGIFHQQCMSCNRCSRRLRRGDRFVLRRGRLLCHAHGKYSDFRF